MIHTFYEDAKTENKSGLHNSHRLLIESNTMKQGAIMHPSTFTNPGACAILPFAHPSTASRPLPRSGGASRKEGEKEGRKEEKEGRKEGTNGGKKCKTRRRRKTCGGEI